MSSLDHPEVGGQQATVPTETPQPTVEETLHRNPYSSDSSQKGKSFLSPSNLGHVGFNSVKEGPPEVAGVSKQVTSSQEQEQDAAQTEPGCETCRKRKKQCDETKPECNQCTRLNLVCRGYAHMSPEQEGTTSKDAPVPLAKKRSFNAFNSDVHACTVCHKWHSPPCKGSQNLQSVLEEQRQRAGSLRPQHDSSMVPYPAMGHESVTTPAANTLADSQAHHWMVQYPMQPSQLPAPPEMHWHSALTAVTQPAPQPMVELSEKYKMLLGKPFLPYDEELIKERRRCTDAVRRFNLLVNPSRGQQQKSLQAIIVPKRIRSFERHYITEHIGLNMQVAAPFLCDYGYNMYIGDSVDIHANCHFSDSAKIHIGKNTTIGTGVRISTLTVPSDSKALKGSNGTQTALEVFIGENVYIGADCSIAAGVKIGDGAIAYPSSVIVHNLPPGSRVRGNPALPYI
ncbi:trimeric LpxA-like protein [Plenodomus tracheiphilus IPT5]|uniref:Trimeric LpxA-like protein n=1 Tax=Plenodomus tracheiphilus IPT5 TaxID=1408161 RepID=A0A6A7B5A7_9PLEO|nr:trimeric LpxA-like protein [Plenodomus tracheiphilus IPT5]